MWRPFVSEFVQHSYLDFKKKIDKTWIKPGNKREKTEKVDIKSLFPYHFQEDDIKQRFQEFKVLQDKVLYQRKMIKLKDMQKEMNEKKKAQAVKIESEKQREMRKRSLIRIRTMASGVRNIRNSKSVGSVGCVFQLTGVQEEQNGEMID